MKANIPVKLDGYFETYININLVADDVNAYQIVYETETDLTGATFNITATRADGVTISDVGTVSGTTASYILANNMYSVVGILKIRLTIVQNGSVLTSKELKCNCIKGNGEPSIYGDDRVPVLTNLIIQADTAIANLQASELEFDVKPDRIGIKKKSDAGFTYTDNLKNLDDTPRNSTFTICAVDTLNQEGADYICSNVNGYRFDDIINNIMDIISSSSSDFGSKIYIRNGSYYSVNDIDLSIKCILEFEDEFDTNAEFGTSNINITGNNITIINGNLKGYITVNAMSTTFLNCTFSKPVDVGATGDGSISNSTYGRYTKFVNCKFLSASGGITIGNAIEPYSGRQVQIINCNIAVGDIAIYGNNCVVKGTHFESNLSQIKVMNTQNEHYFYGNSKTVDWSEPTPIGLYNAEALKMYYCEVAMNSEKLGGVKSSVNADVDTIARRNAGGELRATNFIGSGYFDGLAIGGGFNYYFSDEGYLSAAIIMTPSQSFYADDEGYVQAIDFTTDTINARVTASSTGYAVKAIKVIDENGIVNINSMPSEIKDIAMKDFISYYSVTTIIEGIKAEFKIIPIANFDALSHYDIYSDSGERITNVTHAISEGYETVPLILESDRLIIVFYEEDAGTAGIFHETARARVVRTATMSKLKLGILKQIEEDLN